MEVLAGLLVLGILLAIALRIFGFVVRGLVSVVALMAIAGIGLYLFWPNNLPEPDVTVSAAAGGGWDVEIDRVDWADNYTIKINKNRVARTARKSVHVEEPSYPNDEYLPGPVRRFDIISRNSSGDRTTTKAFACTPVVFLAARGTDENPGKEQFRRGIGSRGWRTYLEMMNGLGLDPSAGGTGQLVSPAAVTYPAVYRVGLNVYTTSRNEGKKNLQKHLAQLSNKCPDTKVVLFGYSQGADVVASIWQSKNVDHDQMLGVVTLADPHFNKDWVDQGVVHPQGAVFIHNGVAGDRRMFEDDELDVLQVWCSPKDSVCQAPGKIKFHGDDYDCYEEWAAYRLSQDVRSWLAYEGWSSKSPDQPGCTPGTEGR